MPKLIVMTGLRFGALLVVERAGVVRGGGGRSYAGWRCRCDCGQEVVVSGQLLRRGLRKACAVAGHYWLRGIENTLASQFPSEYRSWGWMKQRCNDEKYKRYKNYGGRGIKICARWKDFNNFIADMKAKPDTSYTLERNDVNGNYEPGNCRWATRAEQARNTTRSVFVMYGGRPTLLLDVCKQHRIALVNVYSRLRIGWSLDRALTTPVRVKGEKKVLVANPATKKFSRRFNLLGRTFGWLTVIERAPSSRDPKKPTKKKYARWRCKCTCGEIVEVRGQHLRSGAVKACARNNHRWKYPPALEIKGTP